MFKSALFALALVLSIAGSTSAQTTWYSDSPDPSVGSTNNFPFNLAAGITTIHFYSAASLAAGGVQPGASLTDLRIAPASNVAASGVFVAPQARITIGHVPAAPVAGLWEANMVNPTIIYDSAFGAYSFPWTADTWTPLPGFSSSGFSWNGVDDIGLYISIAPAATGRFGVHVNTGPRHALSGFLATGAPQSTAGRALNLETTWGSPPVEYQVNQAGAGMTLNGASGTAAALNSLSVASGSSASVGFVSSNVGQPHDIGLTIPSAIAPLSGGGVQLQDGQIVNVIPAGPGFSFLFGGNFPAYPGNSSASLSSTVPVSLGAQMIIFDPAQLLGISLGGPVELNFL